jgi:hypothetical protein
MTAKLRGTVLVVLVALCWLLPAQAQETQTEGIARVIMITPTAGHDQALIEAITGYHKWIAKFEGHHRYQWYEVLTGPHTGKYIARTANHNWADFDAEYEWQKEADEVFARDVAPHVEAAEAWFTTEMREMSHFPESFEGYTHFQVEDWYVKNGQYGKFRRGLQRVSDILKAGNFGGYWSFYSVASGGHGNQVQLVLPNRGWAGMAEPEPSFFDIVSEALGGAEAFDEFMADWGTTFESGHSRMVELMPEASDYGD